MAEIARDPEMVHEMVERVKRLTPSQLAALRALGAVEEAAFDPSAALAQFGLRADLSAAAFDAELRARDAGLLEVTGLGGVRG